jgi:hypothetical protein
MRQLGRDVIAVVDRFVRGNVRMGRCEMTFGSERGKHVRVEVPVIVAAHAPCTISIGKIGRTLAVGGVCLAPAGAASACGHDELSFRPPFEATMTLPYDVIGGRDAIIMRPWDEIRIPEAGDGQIRRRRSTDVEDGQTRAMHDAGAE